ncbi:MAG: hypothetical protein JWL59_4707 [Chthoniobacteraceae bacterium]|nr:hypothetical protein [Chthoniobacteraceae bacterium]
MKTEISRFCEASLESLNALPPALDNAALQMEKAGEAKLLQKPLAALNELRARLRSLVEKLASQQAYLLIFGPLKSGKSTLMNAISGTYVSEVTSLPGYPCLVYVKNGAAPRFSVTRYNGRETVFADGVVLNDMVADSHVALAQQIRVTELRGEQFDPRTHFTEAIRRIDVQFPVQTLAESSTVLVDTPGLYSRMNFGYDVLTKEFRDSAACAVFVVKADNLFLEQVFAEFNQLLGLFSRIFLVINVDSSKRDLRADGTLAPSQESQHPERIIDAFKTLSMAGPLRQAYEEQRVRIHAVDLLSAASVILSRNNENGQAAPASDMKQERAFNGFMADLTNYLNSSDYTLEFIGDTLRQGHTLCIEASQIEQSPELRELKETQRRLTQEMALLDDKIAIVDRLLRVDWTAGFDKVRAENAIQCKTSCASRTVELANSMRRGVDDWYEVNESLGTLAGHRWNPLLIAAGQALAIESQARLKTLLSTTLGGAEPAALVMTDLYAVGFNLGSVIPAAEPALDEMETLAPYELWIDGTLVPVRKLFLDWLLFRKIASVKRRLFGENLEQPIEPVIKRKRLPELSKEVLFGLIDDNLKTKLPALPCQYADQLVTAYVEKFTAGVIEGLRQLRKEFVHQRGERQTPFDLNTLVLNSIEALTTRASTVLGELRAMAQNEAGAAAKRVEPVVAPTSSIPAM